MSSDLGRAWAFASGCCVCGTSDERQLTTTRLGTGDLVIVCGTHELMHRRAGKNAASLSELRGMVKNRRVGRDRRDKGDELGSELESAFSPQRRGLDRRRN